MRLILILSLLFCLSGFAAEVAETSLATPTVPATSAAPAVKEADIPVQLEAPKKATAEGSLFFKAISSLAVIGILGAGAFLLIGKYKRASISKSTAPEIKVLRQHYLGPKKSLAIIRVAGESVLIGITDHNINMIKSLSLLDDDVPEETPTHFQSVFNDTAAAPTTTAHSERAEDQDEFSIAGIRDFVSTKLKTMRSLD